MQINQQNFEQTFKPLLIHIESQLNHQLSEANLPAPPPLLNAMRYSCLGGGKRIRALLVYLSYALHRRLAWQSCFWQQTNLQSIDLAACSVEMIHAYSLIHDDLPCMDDDDMRRGKPSCHKAFDEATALLAGDALQSLAFKQLIDDAQLSNLKHLANSIGAVGMVGGQVLDMHSQTILSQPHSVQLNYLQTMHAQKTGALIACAIYMGCVTPSQNLQNFAQQLGFTFQLMDDVLDATQNSQTLGKTAGKDLAQKKLTFIQCLGLSQSQILLEENYQDLCMRLNRLCDTFKAHDSTKQAWQFLLAFLCYRHY